MVRCRFLFATDLGDPVSSVYLNDSGCMAGTMLGKVWMYTFDGHVAETLTAFSEEGVRGLYLDQDCGFATLSEGCRGWKRAAPHAQTGTLSFRNIDKKNAQGVKHVLQRGPWACVLFPNSSTVIHVPRQEHYPRSLKVYEFGSWQEVAPCDYDGESLVVVDRTQPVGCPIFRLIQLERNEHIEIDSLPKASRASLVKLWGPDCLAYAVGNKVLVFDYRLRQVRHTLSGHRGEVVAIDSSDDEIVATLDTEAVVKLWCGATGECRLTLHVPEANYFLGYPYCLCLSGNRVMVSADEGAFLVEFDEIVGQASVMQA
eukprot:TRINITY_DN63472_c0_g1_i1.p1 TRINITY_DN63472_c0_g1~~TRINITY_DN63472_c0_g1_i1.p1  ORF type:complete len:326 (+),score=43.01 TRINITY_DN63472_c0_g1_i1:38-979(+)